MQKLTAGLWLLIPVVVVAWHKGPGQTATCRATTQPVGPCAEAPRLPKKRRWPLAETCFGRALDALPADASDERRALQLARTRAQIRSGQMLEGQQQLAQLLTDLQEDEHADKQLLADVRYESAWASYYAAWQMRLDGGTADQWKPEAEQARQQFPAVGRIGCGRFGRARDIPGESGGHDSIGANGPERAGGTAETQELPQIAKDLCKQKAGKRAAATCLTSRATGQARPRLRRTCDKNSSSSAAPA